ncbi:unnamed protein product [Schistosoma mattheei]|uniref:Uncharacterized protein n=1 Tax=Schistosoma mattheei TaxID=31246 RepID=A0A3P8GW76_9TREM|nr:unnamed protein product [Schistosoma mattheei]
MPNKDIGPDIIHDKDDDDKVESSRFCGKLRNQLINISLSYALNEPCILHSDFKFSKPRPAINAMNNTSIVV